MSGTMVDERFHFQDEVIEDTITADIDEIIPESRIRCYSCNQSRFWILLVLLCLSGGIIGGIVYATLPEPSTPTALSEPAGPSDPLRTLAPIVSPVKSETEVPTVSPLSSVTLSVAPTPARTTSDISRRSVMTAILEPFFLTDIGRFPSSLLQGQAMDWLSDEDSWLPSVSSGDDESSVIWLERYIAAILFFSLNGESLRDNNFWVSSHSVCDWIGIQCNTDGQVLEIILYNDSLSGNIPSELGMLTQMTSFKAEYNQISGNIPTHLGILSQLQTIDVSYNQLSGEIPTELGRLNRLVNLILSHNNLSGVVPVELESLGKSGTHVWLGTN